MNPALFRPVHRIIADGEIDSIPHRLGWKFEIYGGRVHITPTTTAIIPLCLELSPKEEDTSRAAVLRSVRDDDEIPLIRLFQAAFKLSVEYAGYSYRALRKEAARSIHGFFERDRSGWPTVSRLVELDGIIVAAALIASGHKSPILQPLFVHPQHHRCGWATTLMNVVVNPLREQGVTKLYSRCHLGNARSLNWHLKYGFAELPDVWVAAHRARHFQYEVDRHERLGDLSAEEFDALNKEADSRWDEWRRLIAMEEKDYNAVHPMMKDW